jgi:glycosyltransferase involved in cell wall biosynthesis
MEEIKFIVFGNNDDTIKARQEYLADLRRRKEGFNNIEIIARPEGVHGDEKWHYIDSSLIGVVPSLYEPFGMVIPEYMARGLPVITTLIPGAIDIFKSPRLGITPYGIIADTTPESMADAMEWMLSHPDETKMMGQNAAERGKFYKWSAVLQETMEVYSSKANPLTSYSNSFQFSENIEQNNSFLKTA